MKLYKKSHLIRLLKRQKGLNVGKVFFKSKHINQDIDLVKIAPPIIEEKSKTTVTLESPVDTKVTSVEDKQISTTINSSTKSSKIEGSQAFETTPSFSAESFEKSATKITTKRLVTLEEYAKTKEKTKKKSRLFGSLAFFLGPYAVTFALFFVFPLVFGVIMSFCNFEKGSIWPTGIATGDASIFENYAKALNNPLGKNFFNGLKNTVLFCLAIVPLGMIVPLGLAMLVAIKPPGYKVFRTLIYLPGIFPLTATGLILIRMFGTTNGFVNHFFAVDIDWLGSVINTWLVIGIFCIWGGIGGNFIIFSAALENVDKTLYEAAKMDGAGFWYKLRYVTLPGIKPQLKICLFTTIIGYMNLYGQNLIIASNTPDQDGIKTAIFAIQDLLKNGSFGTRIYGIASATALCLGVIIALISIVQMRVTRDKKGGHKREEAYLAWKELS